MKSVAVIIPTYNRWPLVRSAIDSVLSQTYQRTSCVVVDDASTDKSVEELKNAYGNKIDIIAITENQGQSACKNIGVESASSDYICFLDSDDILYPEAVASRVSVLSETSNISSLASFGIFRTPSGNSSLLLNKKNRGDSLQIKEYIENRAWCNNNGFLIERNSFIKSGMFNTKLHDKEDLELLIRLLSNISFYYCGETIGEVREIYSTKRQRNCYDKIIQQGYIFSDIIVNNPRLCEKIGQKHLASLVSIDTEDMLRALYRSGTYPEFRKHYRQAIKKGHLQNHKNFFKRYILSYLMQVFQYKKK